MYNVILVDMNAVGYQSNSTRKLNDGDGNQTQAVFQSIKQMIKFKRLNPDARIICLWDEHCQFRFDIYPEYKSKRDDNPKVAAEREEYRKQRPLIKEALEKMGIQQLSYEGLEADDLAYWISKKLSDNGKRVLLVTGDKDWLQLVNPFVHWYNLHNDEVVDTHGFEKKTGFKTTKQFLESKYLQGDNSDCIPGVGGLGELTAQRVINHFGSIAELIKAYRANGEFEKEDLPKELTRARKKINAFCSNENGGLEILKRNIALMDMSKSPKPSGLKMEKPKFSKEETLVFFEDNNFISLANQIDTVERLFA